MIDQTFIHMFMFTTSIYIYIYHIINMSYYIYVSYFIYAYHIFDQIHRETFHDQSFEIGASGGSVLVAGLSRGYLCIGFVETGALSRSSGNVNGKHIRLWVFSIFLRQTYNDI